MPAPIRLGTRASRLALAQARIVQHQLRTRYPDHDTEIVPLQTQGDRDKATSLVDLGGKGIFIKEIEHALVNHQVDIAIHSLKDVTTHLADGCQLSGFLGGESIRDAVVCQQGTQLDDLVQGAKIGTGSQRRVAQLKQSRPDLVFEDIRGNIDTRIQKIRDGVLDAIMISEVGLIRLDITDVNWFTLSPETFYPAPGQGIIGLETRKDDTFMVSVCHEMTPPKHAQIAKVELAFVTATGFDCRSPLGVFSEILDESYRLKIFTQTPSGKPIYDTQTWPADRAEQAAFAFGKQVASQYFMVS